MNLLKETIKFIELINKSIEDIIFIGSDDGEYSCTWDEFTTLADKEYGTVFGAEWVALDLIILFKDGSRIYRQECDGSENWLYVSNLQIPNKTKKIKNLFTKNGGWENLSEINEE